VKEVDLRFISETKPPGDCFFGKEIVNSFSIESSHSRHCGINPFATQKQNNVGWISVKRKTYSLFQRTHWLKKLRNWGPKIIDPGTGVRVGIKLFMTLMLFTHRKPEEPIHPTPLKQTESNLSKFSIL